MIAVESYRQAIRNNRLLAKVLVVLTLIILIEAGVIVSLFPLKTTEHILYEFSSSGQTFYRISSAEDLLSREKALVKMFMRRYIFDRETIDNLTEKVRFNRVGLQSLDSIFIAFEDLYIKIKQNIGDTGTRKIIIETDHAFNNNFNSFVYVVNFQAISANDKKQINNKYFKAVIGYQVVAQKIRLDDLVQNPLGIEVVSYAIYAREV